MAHVVTDCVLIGNFVSYCRLMEFLHDEAHTLDWPEYGEDENYLVFAHPLMDSSLRTGLLSEQANFWNKLIPAYLESHLPTRPKRGQKSQTFKRDEL